MASPSDHHSHSHHYSTSHLLPPTSSNRRSGSNMSTHSHRSVRSWHSQASQPRSHIAAADHIHIHPQHHNILINTDTVGINLENVLVAEQQDLIEDELESDEDHEREDLEIQEENARRKLREGSRRRSVQWASAPPYQEGSPSAETIARSGTPTLLVPATPGGKSRSPSARSSGVQIDAAAAQEAEGGSDDSSFDEGSLDWAKLREGSIARRRWWRRPTPYWLLPQMVISALAIGMGAAPKQELFVNLACLAHPPRTQSATGGMASLVFGNGDAGNTGDIGPRELARRLWYAPVPTISEAKDQQTPFDEIMTTDASLSTEYPASMFYVDDELDYRNVTIQPHHPSDLPPLTPADKWMLDVQRRMAADEARRRKLASGHQVNGTAPVQPITDPKHEDEDPSRPGTGNGKDGLPHGPVPGRPHAGSGEIPSTHGNEGGSIPTDGSDADPADNGGVHGEDEIKPGEIDPRLCKKNPRVQAAAAELTMVMTLCMGILSAITTSFWGATSDRIGRKRIFSISLTGLMFNDVILITTATYPHLVPGGYRFLILGPIIDGCLGGISTLHATGHAYLSDSTPDGSRAKVFSWFMGFNMIGMAIGPIIGSSMIAMTGNILIVFYIAVCCNGFFILWTFFVLPESLSTEARAALAKIAYAKAQKAREREQAERDWENDASMVIVGDSGWSRFTTATFQSTKSKRMRGNLTRLRRRMFSFLEPLAMFLPKEREVPDRRGGYVIKKDYNLTLLITAHACLASMASMYQLKSQYTIFMFGWTSAELGPYMTGMSACRALTMLVFFPFLVRMFKPKIPFDPYLKVDDTAVGVLRSPQTLADSKFDLRIIRFSIMFDMCAYVGMCFIIPQELFILLTGVVTFGSCAGPATNSLALNLLDTGREAGRLFGAMSVVGAMSSAFIGPMLFNLVFASTVGWYAPTIFMVAVCMYALASTFLWSIRLPKFYPRADIERGRSRNVKRVKSSSGVARVVA